MQASLIIILILLICSCQAFPHIIWTYWQSPIQQSSYLIQLFNKRFELISKESGYEYRYVHDKILGQYIQNVTSQIHDILRLSQRQPRGTAKSDLIRMTLLKQHGGVYFDLSAILLDQFQLKWLDNLSKYKHLIINQYTQNIDVLMFTYGKYESTVITKNINGQPFNDYPGYQIWFIAAQKDSTLIKDWVKKYHQFTIKGFQYYTKKFHQQDVFIRNIDNLGSYWSGNMALMYTLHQKQIYLDRNSTILSKHINVHEHYKLCAIHGQIGPLYANPQHIFKLFHRTLKQIQQEDGKIFFFIKLNGAARYYIETALNNLKQHIVNPQVSFDQLIQKPPNGWDCGYFKLILKGSAVYELLSDGDKQLYKNTIVNQQQIKQFQSHCTRKHGITYIEQAIGFSSIIPTISILSNGKSFTQYLQKFNKYWANQIFNEVDNSRTLLLRIQDKNTLSQSQDGLLSYVENYLYANRVFGFYTVCVYFVLWALLGFISVGKIVLGYLIKALAWCFAVQAISENQNRQDINHQYSVARQFTIFYILIALRLAFIAIGACIHFGNMQLGMHCLPFQVMLLTLAVTIYQQYYNFILRKIYIRSLGFTLTQFDHLSKPSLYFYLAYACLTILKHRFEYLVPYAVIFGVITPCLFQIIQTLKSINIKNKLIVNICKFGNNKYLAIISVILIIINLIPRVLAYKVFNVLIKQVVFIILWLQPVVLSMVIACLVFVKLTQIRNQYINRPNTQKIPSQDPNYQQLPCQSSAVQIYRPSYQLFPILSIQLIKYIVIILLWYHTTQIPIKYNKFKQQNRRFYHLQLVYLVSIVYYMGFRKLISNKLKYGVHICQAFVILYLLYNSTYKRLENQKQQSLFSLVLWPKQFQIIIWKNLYSYFCKIIFASSYLFAFYSLFYYENINYQNNTQSCEILTLKTKQLRLQEGNLNDNSDQSNIYTQTNDQSFSLQNQDTNNSIQMEQLS